MSETEELQERPKVDSLDLKSIATLSSGPSLNQLPSCSTNMSASSNQHEPALKSGSKKFTATVNGDWVAASSTKQVKFILLIRNIFSEKIGEPLLKIVAKLFPLTHLSRKDLVNYSLDNLALRIFLDLQAATLTQNVLVTCDLNHYKWSLSQLWGQNLKETSCENFI